VVTGSDEAASPGAAGPEAAASGTVGRADGAGDPLASSSVVTRRGDDGSTSLLFGGGRIAKDDPRTEAYGTLDEAVAAFGLARAELAEMARHGTLSPALDGIAEVILRLQRELFVVAAELAANPDAWGRLQDGSTRVSLEMVDGLEVLIADLEPRVEMPREFIVPGETRASAALEVARTIVRRAERRAVALDRAGLVAGAYLVPYLNRLADLAWILARAEEQGEHRHATPSRQR
jgi:cob(I)alamin adenosyltransferase